MNIQKEKFAEIVNKYDLTICGNADVEDAFRFVIEVLQAEADAIRKSEPYATVTIDKYEDTAKFLSCDVDVDWLADTYDELFR
jgi:hypothetical protein